MSWADDDDFERDMAAYSEIETIEVPVESVPQTIRQYEQIIQSNNACSIFDSSDYSDPQTANASASTSLVVPASESNYKSILKDEDVIKVTSGRGRGGRNIFHKPGDIGKSRLPDDEHDVIQRLRKVAPIGYGNEITETAVRAHHKAKQDQQKSEQSSPAISECSSPATLRNTTAALRPKKGAECEIFNSPSKASTASCKSEDIEIFDSFAFQCQNSSSSPQPSEHSNASAKFEDAESDIEEATIPNGHSTHSPLVKENVKPIPLSEMLKPARETRRRQQREQRSALSAQHYENELASRRAIQEIYREDLKKKHVSSRSPCSSSSANSQDEVLPWRSRTNSPPRFPWGQNHKRREDRLNVNSCLDFPPLK